MFGGRWSTSTNGQYGKQCAETLMNDGAEQSHSAAHADTIERTVGLERSGVEPTENGVSPVLGASLATFLSGKRQTPARKTWSPDTAAVSSAVLREDDIAQSTETL
jgi:hypothetical protein